MRHESTWAALAAAGLALTGVGCASGSAAAPAKAGDKSGQMEQEHKCGGAKMGHEKKCGGDKMEHEGKDGQQDKAKMDEKAAAPSDTTAAAPKKGGDKSCGANSCA